MIDKEYIARLTSMTADVRKLNAKMVDAKKIKLNGVNLEDLLSNDEGKITSVKHSQDTREVITQNDLWGTYVEVSDNGEIMLHDDEVKNPRTGNMDSWNENITKVQNNKAFIGDTLFGNVQTEKIKDGYNFFYYAALESFDSDLSNLKKANTIFTGCYNLKSFYSDLTSLEDGNHMFSWCYYLQNFERESERNPNLITEPVNLSSLVNGKCMFYYCGNLSEFTSDLSELKNGWGMFQCCDKLTNFNSNLSSLEDGCMMFESCRSLTDFGKYTGDYYYFADIAEYSCDLGSLVKGMYMFNQCNSLENFDANLDSLKYADGMFSRTKIKSFTNDMPALVNGDYMFDYCNNLSEFTSDLSSLERSVHMFSLCIGLNNFDVNLQSVKHANYMFYNCSNLTTFTSDLSSLVSGISMFESCSALTSFTSDLSSLLFGSFMLHRCALDDKSLMYIAHSINDVSNLTEEQICEVCGSSYGFKEIGIGIGHEYVSDFSKLPQETRDYLNMIHDKGWQIQISFPMSANGGNYQPTSLIPIDDEETTTPIPYYAKPVQCDEKNAKYVNSNGEYFNIIGGNLILVDDPETYGLFVSEEDAAANMGLILYERPISKTKNEKLKQIKEYFQNRKENQPTLF